MCPSPGTRVASTSAPAPLQKRRYPAVRASGKFRPATVFSAREHVTAHAEPPRARLRPLETQRHTALGLPAFRGEVSASLSCLCDTGPAGSDNNRGQRRRTRGHRKQPFRREQSARLRSRGGPPPLSERSASVAMEPTGCLPVHPFRHEPAAESASRTETRRSAAVPSATAHPHSLLPQHAHDRLCGEGNRGVSSGRRRFFFSPAAGGVLLNCSPLLPAAIGSVISTCRSRGVRKPRAQSFAVHRHSHINPVLPPQPQACISETHAPPPCLRPLPP